MEGRAQRDFALVAFDGAQQEVCDAEFACGRGAENRARTSQARGCGDREFSSGDAGEVGPRLRGAEERKPKADSGPYIGLWTDRAVRAETGIRGGGGGVWRVAVCDGRAGSSAGEAKLKFG